MKFELESYLPLLDESDLSLDQKEQLTRTVWNFMGAQVDLAFGIHPVQCVDQHRSTTQKE